jgi:hypothetical protein
VNSVNISVLFRHVYFPFRYISFENNRLPYEYIFDSLLILFSFILIYYLYYLLSALHCKLIHWTNILYFWWQYNITNFYCSESPGCKSKIVNVLKDLIKPWIYRNNPGMYILCKFKDSLLYQFLKLVQISLIFFDVFNLPSHCCLLSYHLKDCTV